MAVLLWWIPPIIATLIAVMWLVAGGQRDRRERARIVSGRSSRKRADALRQMSEALARPLPTGRPAAARASDSSRTTAPGTNVDRA